MKMRLSPEMGVQMIESSGEDDVLKHISIMYRGTTSKAWDPVNGARLERFESHDKNVIADRPIHNDRITTVRIRKLELQRQATRLLALRAYQEMMSIPFDRLMVDVPDLTAHEQWSRYTTQAEWDIHEQDMDFSVIASPGAAKGKSDKRYNVRLDGPNRVSTIITTGENLPAAANRLVEGYRNLRLKDQDDAPDVAVARLLGASSMGKLDKVWRTAIEGTPPPLDAGLHVLDMLKTRH